MSPVVPWSLTPAAPVPITELERIYNEPFTAPVLELFERFRGKALDGAGLDAFCASVPGAANEAAKLTAMLAGGFAGAPDLTTRAGQLVWAAGLGHVAQSVPPGLVKNHSVWRAVAGDDRVAGSLGASARYIDLAVSNRNVTMDWGVPGSWFYFQPDTNHINIDLFYTLATGFDDDRAPGLFGIAHATAVMMHEVGHSQLTTRFTDGMQALKARENVILDAAKLAGQVTPADYKALARIHKEFELRMMVMNAAEDNCVNQYAATQGKQFPHDFGQSLNIANVLLQGSGEKLRKGVTGAAPTGAEAEAQAALSRLYTALATAFHTTNGLFATDDADTWRRIGVDPDAVVAQGASAPLGPRAFLGQVDTDFERLMDMSAGPNGLTALQPKLRDRWLLRGLFNRSVASFADRRCRIIDQIWDQYAAPYAQVLIDAAEAQADAAMDAQAQNPANQPKSAGQGQPQNGQGAGGDDAAQADPSGAGAGEGTGGQAGEGQSGAGQSGAGQASDARGSGPADGQGSGAASGDAPGEGDAGGTGDGDEASGTVMVAGVGTMPVDGPLPDKPLGAGDGGADADGPDVDAKTLRELLQELRKAEQEAGIASSAGGAGGLPDAPDLGMGKPAIGGRGRGIDLTALSGGSWVDFRKRVNELEPVIARVVDDFSYIRDRQRQSVRQLTSSLDILPRGGNIRDRLDMRRHTDFVMKRMTGQKINEDDLRRWKREDVQSEPTTTELWVLGDGSGSMEEALPGGGRRIDSAVQSMAILYEAGRRAQFDTYVGMWGDDHIRLIAEPGSDEKSIGAGFERVRNGINSGTQLSPSFAQAVGLSAKMGMDAQGRTRRFAGMTHFLIISDGELNYSDIEPTQKMILDLFRYGPAVSVDIAVLGGSGNEMRQVVDHVRAANPRAMIDMLRADKASDIPLLLAGRIKQRFEQAAAMTRAVPDIQKREAFARAQRSFALN